MPKNDIKPNMRHVQQLSKQELKAIRGGESQTYSVPGFNATATGDNVDIQQLANGGISITSRSSSGSGSSFSKTTSYTSGGGNSNSTSQLNSFSS
ncbi:MAG: hypothetical protein ACRC1Z_10245 [Waterburya sp.]